MMNTQETSLPFTMPSNKFYPPHIDQSQSLLRTRLLTGKLPEKIKSKKAVIVEAQAGQGKTTLIAQFLKHNNFEFIWYQIGPEDSDPVLLLSSLLANLNQKYPDFHSPQLGTILQDGEVGPLDLKRCANILLNDINIYLSQDLFIVFDDLHLASSAALTNKLLEYLIDTSPPRLHFVLATRHPLEIKCKTFRDVNRISYLSTEDLALSNGEIEDLFTNVFATTITPQDAGEIQRITNGWVMGIVLASHPMTGRRKFWKHSGNGSISTAHAKQAHMLDYFQDEIFDKISDYLHTPFLTLSCISEIPTDLAKTLTGIDHIGSILNDMARENFFVYRLDDEGSLYRFHHFFQEFLQIQAQQELSSTDIKTILSREAEYYFEREMVEKALSCYRKAGDFLTMERLLQAKGTELVARNKTLTILSLLDTIPQETLYQYSWLTFYAGLLRNDYSPKTTLPYYERARELFIENGDETGELLCLSQMIYYHFVISGKYNEGSQLLPLAAKLLKKNQAILPDNVKILAARNLASGYCFFNGQMDRARSYVSMASTLATRQDSLNFIASASFIQGYIELLSGNRAKYLREAERCFSLLNDPLVGMSNKLTIRVMYLCYLSMSGDFLNFNIHQQAIQDSIDPTIVDQTVAAPYLFIWGAICHFSMGKREEAMALLNKGFGITSSASTAHMHSQLLQWQAFGAALNGETDRTLELIAESTALRNEAGGFFYEVFNTILAGAAYIRIGEFDKALSILDPALEQSESIPSTFLTICGLLQRSYCKLLAFDAETALDDLETGLALMRNNGYTHFWGWEPEMMAKLLSLAVRFDIEKSFSNGLAQERLMLKFTDEGVPFRLLDFNLLDDFQIKLGDTIVSRAKDLTPSQRELLGLLLTAKGQRISQERIQLELWPDNTPENARKSFDTLLTRLRKELSNTKDLQVRSYIFMQKGILCLANYRMDSLQFSEAARRAMVHSKNSDWWQAENAFTHALWLWKGALPEDTFKSEQVLNYNDQLVNTLIEFTTIWSQHLAETGRIDEAIALIEQVLQTYKLEEHLVTLLYALYVKNNSPIKARETLERYRAALKKIEYEEAEITEYLQDVVSQAKSKRFDEG